MAAYEASFSMESFRREVQPECPEDALAGALEYVKGYLEDDRHDRSIHDVVGVLVAARRSLDSFHDHQAQ